MQLHSALLVALSLTSAFAPAALAQDAPGPGYELAILPYPSRGLVATLGDESFLVYDADGLTRYAADGNLVQTLTTFASPVTPSFVELDPTESFAVIGDASSGTLFTVDLAGGGRSPLTTLAAPIDAEFEGPGSLIVNAGVGGVGTSAQIQRVDTSTGTTTLLATVSGDAGALTIDGAGNLYYAEGGGSIFGPPASARVLRFDAAQLASGAVLDSNDATVIGTGFEDATSLACDPLSGDVFLLENVLSAIQGTPTKRVYRVASTRATSEIVFEGAQSFALGSLEYIAGDPDATFTPYQPQAAGELRVVRNDAFFMMDQRMRVRPERPRMHLSGPGSTGVGLGFATLDPAPPNGVAVYLFGVPGLQSPVELPYSLGGAPVLSGIDPFTAIIGPVLPLDANGVVSLLFFNNGTLGGSAVIQAVCVDPVLGIVGSSTTAFL